MCCIAASLPCCNSYQLPVSIGYRTLLALLGSMECWIFYLGMVSLFSRERAALDLFTPVQLPNIWVLPWEQERPGALCV